MNQVYPLVPLGKVIRDIVKGAEIKTKKQQFCKKGDFLVAEIDAKIGGFGIVPENLDRAIVVLRDVIQIQYPAQAGFDYIVANSFAEF